MNTKDLRFAVPAGQHLIDEIEARDIDFVQLKAHLPELTSQADLADGTTAITEDMAARIEAVLEIPAKVWLDLEQSYRKAIGGGLPGLSKNAINAAQAKATSGKLLLRLPVGLHRRAAEAAKVEGISLNQLLLSYIAEGIGRTEGTRSHR